MVSCSPVHEWSCRVSAEMLTAEQPVLPRGAEIQIQLCGQSPSRPRQSGPLSPFDRGPWRDRHTGVGPGPKEPMHESQGLHSARHSVRNVARRAPARVRVGRLHLASRAAAPRAVNRRRGTMGARDAHTSDRVGLAEIGLARASVPTAPFDATKPNFAGPERIWPSRLKTVTSGSVSLNRPYIIDDRLNPNPVAATPDRSADTPPFRLGPCYLARQHPEARHKTQVLGAGPVHGRRGDVLAHGRGGLRVRREDVLVAGALGAG